MNRRSLWAAAVTICVAAQPSGVRSLVVQSVASLTDQQIQSAIDLGRAGEVPTVKISSFIGDFDVLIDGPVARIAAAAAAATQRYKPFSIRDVTPDMRAPYFVVSLRQRADARAVGSIQNVVLEPKGSTSVEAAIQPIHQSGWTASFDHLPDGEFDVFVVLKSERQKYSVSLKDRVRLDYPFGAPPISTASPESRDASAVVASPAGRSLRLSIQGDGQRHADAIRALEDELRAAGFAVVVTQRTESYDYMIILGEGGDAASAVALDPQGTLVAQAVRKAMTERGAVEGASRELGRKLAARSRRPESP